MLSLLTLFLYLACSVAAYEVVFSDYPSLGVLSSTLASAVGPGGACENLGKMGDVSSIKSVQGRSIPYLLVSANPVHDIKSPRPALRMAGTIHGNEPLSTVLLPTLALFMCDAYNEVLRSPESYASFAAMSPYKPDVSTSLGTKYLAYRLVRDADLYFLPVVNPDGYVANRRENANWVDLNRDFPDPILQGSFPKATGSEQPETRALMSFYKSRRFVASGVMHEGATVVNYPYDGLKNLNDWRGANYSKDHSTFVHLSNTYASKNTAMRASTEFTGGITNGAEWYTIYGGSQDYSYLGTNTMELTLELNDVKHPPASTFQAIFDQNAKSVLSYWWTAAFGGLRGNVMTLAGPASGARKLLQGGAMYKPVANALICVGPSPYNTYSGVEGEFHRPLAPGKFKVTVSAPGYKKRVFNSVTIPKGYGGLNMTIVLEPQ